MSHHEDEKTKADAPVDETPAGDDTEGHTGHYRYVMPEGPKGENPTGDDTQGNLSGPLKQ